VGVELTNSIDASIGFDPTMVRRMPARLPARGVGDSSGGTASTAPVPVPSSASSSRGPVVDVTFTVAQAAPEEVLVRLQSERAALNGGYSHPHTAVDCAFCRRAVAAYR
jgi:hypothetical protein